jgi:hypothetical protein
MSEIKTNVVGDIEEISGGMQPPKIASNTNTGIMLYYIYERSVLTIDKFGTPDIVYSAFRWIRAPYTVGVTPCSIYPNYFRNL